MTVAILLVLAGVLSRLLPHPPNAVAMGAMALYAGARLPPRWALLVPLAALGISDVFLDAGSGRPLLSVVRLTGYATFAGIVLLGGASLRSGSFLRPAALTPAASTLFFLTSNLAVWAAGGLYPRTPTGLVSCYVAALPFYGNSLLADLAGMAVLFGLDTLARRDRATRRAAAFAATAASLMAPGPAAAQVLPTDIGETVVVTATLTPEEEAQLGSAVTVITRDEIERSGALTMLELLRLVPGLDVVRTGSDGSAASVFLRGTNSTQTLVLVDGVRVNPVYFAGFDFGQLTTENVERIEVVRGPFSPLYGSDAIGGVIQIFTRGPAAKPAGLLALEGGVAGQRQGTIFASAGSATLGGAVSYREARVDGDRPNSDWRQQNGSLRVDFRPAEGIAGALEASVLDGEIGVPGPVGGETPRARSTTREERLALPLSFRPAPGHEARILLGRADSELTFEDPDSAFASDTESTTHQARFSDSWKTKRQTLTAFVAWERWEVTPEDSFGTTLAEDGTSIWGAGLQESVRLGERWRATFGARYDRHSDFGGALSPRTTVAWLSAGGRWKARASAGRAFRAPTVGELFFPSVGNPDLEPERSSSFEVGVERYLKGGRVETSLFWNDIRELIVFEFSTLRNENVGRARTRGVELAWRKAVHPRVDLDTGATWLDAEDRATGEPLLRRPRHRAFAAVSVRPMQKLRATARATFVGRRADVDALTFARIENPSYVRYDLFVRYDAKRLAPYLRIENAGDRRYAEADGFPAPRRRYAVGFEARL